MKKASESGDWLQKESARLASILQKKTLAPSKLDEIQRKYNILAAFVEEQVASAGDGAQHLFNQGSEGAKVAASSVSSAAAEASGYVAEAAAGATDRVKAEL